MQNRRNYYRLLQVQPDASPMVIKAAYRTMMQKLKYHPDLGGDHETAALLNEAYRVLLDPDLRRAYDLAYMAMLEAGRNQEEPEIDMASPQKPQAPYPQTQLAHCLFCKTPYQETELPEADRCVFCHSPLKLLPHEHQLKRAVSRIEQHGDAKIYTYWPQQPIPAKIEDLSPLGVRLSLARQLTYSQIIKIDSELLQAVARVANIQEVNLASNAKIFYTGLEFLSVCFDKTSGGFFNAVV